MKLGTKEFNKLQAEWDQKLADSGFVDIEQRDGHIKKSSRTKFGASSEVAMSAKEEYYRYAGYFLHDYPFPTHVHRRIWELHSQGQGRFRIMATLKAEKVWFESTPKERSKSPYSLRVQKIIEHLRSEMFKKIKDDRQNNKE